MARSIVILLGIILALNSYSQAQYKAPKLGDYLPKELEYNPEVPKPKDVLGFEIGEQHVSHDQMLRYLQVLAGGSNRLKLQEYARSAERRPLVILVATAPENHNNLDQIRTDHLKISKEIDPVKPNLKSPLVVYQGFSVHGNEASGGNAALLLAYILAAGSGEWLDALMSKTVILLDPCLNPDGFNRFASWVNQHRSATPSGDPATREHHEVWPGGRTNHYWFDLNRDWLPMVHPESQGRIRLFHQWKPNLLTDHHEMGSHSTFFFQPGVQSRVNPNTPLLNQELTAKIGEFHAKALDQIGVSYFTKEIFDDFYYGKGSTYPDVNGSIGILFEQASARGHLQESTNGMLSFPFAINNQLTTALSTLTAAIELRSDLLNYQHDFYLNARADAAKDPVKAYVFGTPEDPWRLNAFNGVMHAHGVRVYHLPKEVSAGGMTFKVGEAYLIPLRQSQYRLIKSLFSTETTFTDSLFYDVSAFTLPLAYNLVFQPLKNALPEGVWLQKQWTPLEFPPGEVKGSPNPVAYLIPWSSTGAPALAYHLLKSGLKLRVATNELVVKTIEGKQKFPAGTLVLHPKRQEKSDQEIRDLLSQLAVAWGVNITGATSGLALKGIDLGSPSLRPVDRPKVLVLSGSGVNAYEAGEAWHTLDKRFGMEPAVVDIANFGRLDLSRYSAIVMPHGSYKDLNGSLDKIKRWVSAGGILICQRRAVKWVAQNGLANLAFYNRPVPVDPKRELRLPYSGLDRDRGAQIVGGAICQAKIDLTHPLGYGYVRETLPVFRKDTFLMKPTQNPYATPMVYAAEPLLAGYMSGENREAMASTAGIVVSGLGQGKVICMADNPNFRGFWMGTQKLFLNAIFFGKIIKGGAAETKKPPQFREQKPEIIPGK